MAMFDIHPMLSAGQNLAGGSSSVPGDPGASFGKQSPDMAIHVAPASAANYGTSRLTAWDTKSFGVNRGSANYRGSFVNWDNSAAAPTTPAALGAQQQGPM